MTQEPTDSTEQTSEAEPAGDEAESALQTELAKAHAEVSRLDDQWRRSVADLDNLRKRHQREREREQVADRARAAQAVLPIVDNLELALQHAGDDTGGFVDGVRAVFTQAVEAMGQLGFPRFEADGEPFDPSIHEAVSSVPVAEHAGSVLATARPGYGTREALLRPASVVVAVAPPS